MFPNRLGKVIVCGCGAELDWKAAGLVPAKLPKWSKAVYIHAVYHLLMM